MLLIVEPRGQRPRARAGRAGARISACSSTARSSAQGLLLASNSLREAAIRLQRRGGKPRVIDGPFTESKELVGGFYLLDCGAASRRCGSPANARPPNGRASRCAKSRPATSDYICAAQELHHPAAFTSLPGKSWHGPWGSRPCPDTERSWRSCCPAVAPWAASHPPRISPLSLRARSPPTAARRGERAARSAPRRRAQATAPSARRCNSRRRDKRNSWFMARSPSCCASGRHLTAAEPDTYRALQARGAGAARQLEDCAKVSIMSPVPPRETCATTAVRRWSLVMVPRLMANDSTTCCPLRRPEVSRLDEDAGGAQVHGLAQLASAARHRDVDDRAGAMPWCAVGVPLWPSAFSYSRSVNASSTIMPVPGSGCCTH